MTDQISKEWFTYPPATNNAMGHRHFRQIIVCDFHLEQRENMNETDRIVNPSNMIFSFYPCVASFRFARGISEDLLPPDAEGRSKPSVDPGRPPGSLREH